MQKAQAIYGFKGFIFPDDERFLNPPRMLKAIKKQLEENGQIYDKNPAVMTKIILDSLAFRYASVLETIENLTNNKIEGVQIIGGGGQNDYLNQMTANICGKTVKAGLTEATVTGNLIVQAVSSQRFKDLAEARKYVGENIALKTYQPIMSDEIEKAKQNYLKLEKKFLGK